MIPPLDLDARSSAALKDAKQDLFALISDRRQANAVCEKFKFYAGLEYHRGMVQGVTIEASRAAASPAVEEALAALKDALKDNH